MTTTTTTTITDPFVARISGEVVRLTGEVVRRFCNGMYTNNARDLPVGSGQRTAMLDERGRLQGIFDLYCESDTRFVCALEGVSADDFRDRYAMYMMLDDIELDVLDWQIATVQGSSAPVGGFVMARDRSGLGGFDVVGPPEIVAQCIASSGVPQLDAAAVDEIRIRAGFPTWPQDMGTKSLPHELRMRRDFLHFDKGCYLGQETVNRVDVMGQVRRNLAGVRILGDDVPPAGSKVLDAADKPVGVLTSPARPSDLGAIGLAVLKRPADEPGTSLTVTDGTRRWKAYASDLPFG
jgi:tRNA-modifying protein YgfZ